jgi:hypothetical protein
MCELQTMIASYQAPERVLHSDLHAGAIDAMVTRLLDRSEAMGNPRAIEAIQKEANGLLAKGTWDLATVREKDDVVAEARANREKTHIGSLMTICSEKFAELEEQFRVLKGRVVYRGDSAKDEEGAAAIYQNLSASPTSIRGMNANIAYGRVPGHKTTSADAVKAYVQAVLNARHPTWVQIPKELRPSHWQFKRPVCRLFKALYGHPESGGHWEIHLKRVIKDLGGENIDEHPGSFWFPLTRIILTTYVDDFLLSGPSEHHASLWAALGDIKKGGIEIEDIGDLSRFLGRHHDTVIMEDGSEGVAFNMREYVRAACERYLSIPGVKPLRQATTPFCPDGSLTAADDDIQGELAKEACSVLMKDLWAARLARPDLTKAITSLASKVSKWTRNHDRMLYRLMSYMWTTKEYEIVGYVHDPLEELWLELYVDADWAGDREDKYSTSGGFLVLAGPNSRFPLMWVSRKQTAVSRSTTESEIIALAHSLFMEAIPMMSLWNRLVGPASGRPIQLKIFEDNQAAITIADSGFSTKLCHISRTHGVNIASIKDEIDKPEFELLKIDTKLQAADIFTKAVEPQKWEPALDMLGIRRSPLPRKGQLTTAAGLTACQPSGDSAEPDTTVLTATAELRPPDGEHDKWDDAVADEYLAIGDTGAGTAVGSLKAFEQQGANTEKLEPHVRPLDRPQRFSTANGILTADSGLAVKTFGPGGRTMHLLQDCPLALSVGEEVDKGFAFVWTPSLPPYFADAKHVKISCPKSRRYEAEHVKSNVPYFKIRVDGTPPKAEPPGAVEDYRRGGSQFYSNKRGGNRTSYVHKPQK